MMDERLLSRIWRALRFDRAGLRTTAGEPVEVVYRGRPHRAPGPDFCDAAVLIAGDLHYGDVEVHVRSSAWPQHRHDRDRRYDGVVLHVVALDDARGEIRTRAGRQIACVEIGDRLGDPANQADLAQQVLPSCRDRLARLSDADLARQLDALGEARLATRVDEFATELELVGPEQVLYERLLEALGFGENRRAFCELARRLPIASLYASTHQLPLAEREIVVESLLFGVAGLLPSRRSLGRELDWPSACHADELESVWAICGDEWHGETMDPDAWTFGVRPLNTPPRRIAAAARLVAGALPTGLASSVAGALLAAGDPREAIRRLVAAATVRAEGSYWSQYFDFGRPTASAAPRLVGPERALVTVVNVFLPFALATSGDGVAEKALRAYAAAPRLAPNEVTRFMFAEVLGERRAKLADSARRCQGLHRLYQLGCDLAACDNCPLFADAYQALPARMPPST